MQTPPAAIKVGQQHQSRSGTIRRAYNLMDVNKTSSRAYNEAAAGNARPTAEGVCTHCGLQATAGGRGCLDRLQLVGAWEEVVARRQRGKRWCQAITLGPGECKLCRTERCCHDGEQQQQHSRGAGSRSSHVDTLCNNAAKATCEMVVGCFTRSLRCSDMRTTNGDTDRLPDRQTAK